MDENNFNHLPRYEDVFDNFKNVLNEYLSICSPEYIHDFNLSIIDRNKGFSNNLLKNDFTPNELVEEIKKSYLQREYINGEIGLTDKQTQYDGIITTALYMLMSNRLGKIYKKEMDTNTNLDEDTKNKYKQNYKQLMAKKTDATIKLIYSLFIYEQTENNNDFLYGLKYDNAKKIFTLVIDLPTYGQISVHIPSMPTVAHIAKQNIDLVLEKKLQLGQITENQFSKLTNESSLFCEKMPLYQGSFYEYCSAIPIDFCGKNLQTAQKDLNLPNEISDEDIKNLSQNEQYNSRELYYFAIKNNFSKNHLKLLSNHLRTRDIEYKNKLSQQKTEKSLDVKSIGHTAIKLTTAEERKQVDIHEANQERFSNIRDQYNSREI